MPRLFLFLFLLVPLAASAIFVMCATWAPAPLGPLSAGPDRVQGGCVLAVYAGHYSDMHLDEGVVEQAQRTGGVKSGAHPSSTPSQRNRDR